MSITYSDIKYKLQPPLDCSELQDLRGQYFHNRIITNYENTDFSGCVLYHCFPSGIPNAFEVNPAQSENDLTLKGANLEEAYLYRANLQGVDLARANLLGADLTGANLQGVDLARANLEGANLARAYLEVANLSGANLQGANLARANLLWADLEGADLSWADLRKANLKGADLRKANLKGAVYNEETDFEDSNITQEQLGPMIFVEDED